MWFVYVKGTGGTIEPEKWSEEQGDCDRNGNVRPFVQKVHLPKAAMDEYSIVELARMYPLDESYKQYVESTDVSSTDELREDNPKSE